jgi:hypothetical protein
VLAGPPSQAELEGEALADLAQAHPLWMTDTDRTPMGADAAGRYLASPLGDRLAAYRRDELARRSVRHIERRLDWAEQTDHPLRPWTADTRDLTWEPTAAYASGPDAEYQQLPPTFDGAPCDGVGSGCRPEPYHSVTDRFDLCCQARRRRGITSWIARFDRQAAFLLAILHLARALSCVRFLRRAEED